MCVGTRIEMRIGRVVEERGREGGREGGKQGKVTKSTTFV